MRRTRLPLDLVRTVTLRSRTPEILHGSEHLTRSVTPDLSSAFSVRRDGARKESLGADLSPAQLAPEQPGAPGTTAVWAESPKTEPDALDPITRRRMVEPESLGVTV